MPETEQQLESRSPRWKVSAPCQTAEYGSFQQDLGEGTNFRWRCAKQLPSADHELVKGQK